MDATDVDERLRDLTQLPAAPAPALAQLVARGRRTRRRNAALGVAATATVVVVLFGFLIPRTTEEEEMVATAAQPTAATTTTTSTTTAAMSQPADITADEQATLQAFIAFARQPSDETFAQVPLAGEVALGLGAGGLVVRRARDELRDPGAWSADGTHSAFDTAARDIEVALSGGEHRTCASENPHPPIPALAGRRQLNIQPTELPHETCLEWFAVELFLDGKGQIVAVVLDRWEY